MVRYKQIVSNYCIDFFSSSYATEGHDAYFHHIFTYTLDHIEFATSELLLIGMWFKIHSH